MGHQGGRGSCLAATAQYVGADGVWFTSDDRYEADLNSLPSTISLDWGTGEGRDPLDRVRPFFSQHPGGAVFSHADGSTHFVPTEINRREYILRSQIRSGQTN